MIARTVRRGGARTLRRIARSRAGAAAVELALILPVAIVVFAGCADYGLMVRTANALQVAARAGATYAAVYPSDAAGIAQAAQSAASLDPTTLTVTPAQFCGCASGAATGCGTSCADGGPTRTYVSVSVSQPYTPVTPFAGFMLPSMLSAQATLRTK
jgi:Flp pilus assembly protein TadG